jgi:hypothetical protein
LLGCRASMRSRYGRARSTSPSFSSRASPRARPDRARRSPASRSPPPGGRRPRWRRRMPARAPSSRREQGEPVPQRQLRGELARRARDDVERRGVVELVLVDVGQAAVERHRSSCDAVVAMSTSSTSACRAAAPVSSYARSRMWAQRARASRHGQELLDDLDAARIVGRELERPLARRKRVDVLAQRIDSSARARSRAPRAPPPRADRGRAR